MNLWMVDRLKYGGKGAVSGGQFSVAAWSVWWNLAVGLRGEQMYWQDMALGGSEQRTEVLTEPGIQMIITKKRQYAFIAYCTYCKKKFYTKRWPIQITDVIRKPFIKKFTTENRFIDMTFYKNDQ